MSVDRFRAYAIERDADGLPARMIWNGDYRRVRVQPSICERCGSRRMVGGRCFDCWWDGRSEEWQPIGAAPVREQE